MVGYTGITGRAAYVGDGHGLPEFTLWSKIDDPLQLLYIYVPQMRASRDEALKILCKGAIKVANGFMVTMPKWESKITAEGQLIA